MLSMKGFSKSSIDPETMFDVQFTNLCGHYVLEEKVCWDYVLQMSLNNKVQLVYCPVNGGEDEHTDRQTQDKRWKNSTVEPPDHGSSDMKSTFLISRLSKSVLCLCLFLVCCLFAKLETSERSICRKLTTHDIAPLFHNLTLPLVFPTFYVQARRPFLLSFPPVSFHHIHSCHPADSLIFHLSFSVLAVWL